MSDFMMPDFGGRLMHLRIGYCVDDGFGDGVV